MNSSVKLDIERCEELAACLSTRRTYLWKNLWQFNLFTYGRKWKASPPRPPDYMCLVKVIYRNCKPFSDEKPVLVIIHSFGACVRAPSRSGWRRRWGPALLQPGEAALCHGAGEAWQIVWALWGQWARAGLTRALAPESNWWPEFSLDLETLVRVTSRSMGTGKPTVPCATTSESCKPCRKLGRAETPLRYLGPVLSPSSC